MSSEKKSIGEIRKEFENVQKEAQTEKRQKALDALCLKYAQDGRKGVQVLTLSGATNRKRNSKKSGSVWM